MLQTHFKQSNSPESTSPGNEFSDRSRDYQTSQAGNNKSEYQNSPTYSQSRTGTAMPYRHETQPPVKYASSNGSTQKLDPIIRVKNFAPSASYKEIRTFLQGVQIEHDGIKLLHDANGQRTGQAFVRLIGIIDLKKALCRNKQFYEDRQIEVSITFS